MGRKLKPFGTTKVFVGLFLCAAAGAFFFILLCKWSAFLWEVL